MSASSSRRRVSLLAWQHLELPALDTTLCTGCGACVPACPTDCLALAGDLPWLPRPRDCISCSLCVLVCPTHALRLEASP